METRTEFARALASLDLTHTERAVAFLWYYRQTQQYEERTASELASDVQDEGFPKPNVSRLHDDLRRSRFTVRGRRPGTFQLDVRRLGTLDERYGEILSVRKVEVHDTVLPQEWVKGTRAYLERLVHQLNGSYQYGFYDACATLSRRLMESLIIDIYIHDKRHHEIQNNGVFFSLDKLISYIRGDSNVTMGRNTGKTMSEIKQLGDTAAHDRVYITEKSDIDDLKSRYRRMVSELLDLAGIQPKG